MTLLPMFLLWLQSCKASIHSAAKRESNRACVSVTTGRAGRNGAVRSDRVRLMICTKNFSPAMRALSFVDGGAQAKMIVRSAAEFFLCGAMGTAEPVEANEPEPAPIESQAGVEV